MGFGKVGILTTVLWLRDEAPEPAPAPELILNLRLWGMLLLLISYLSSSLYL